MSAGLEFKQSLHLCNVSNLIIFLVFQLRTFKVGFSGPKTFRGFEKRAPVRESNPDHSGSQSALYPFLLLVLVLYFTVGENRQ